MLGVGEVIEVVIGYHHVVGILRGRIEPGIDAVVAVPGIEIQRCYQGAGLLNRTHQRIELRQTHDLGVILLGKWRAVGVEGCRAPVIATGIEHATVSDRMALALKLIGLETGIEQRFVSAVAVHLHQRLDRAQPPVDDLRFAQRSTGQIFHGRFLQMLDLRVTNRLIAQQIYRDQHRLHQNQRDQRALHERSPDPLT